MGEYLNPSNRDFQIALHSQIYVDKTGLLQATNEYIDTVNRYLCVSRPRRFGKSMTLNMLTAYYSRGCDSREMFSPLKIASSPDFEKYLNQYNVVRINIVQVLQNLDDENKSISEMLTELKSELIEELRDEFPEIKFPDTTNVAKFFTRVYNQTNIPFIFLIDEWDCVFRERGIGSNEAKSYLYFLRDLLKDRSYVALAYMTGILPIKKYGEHSALNMFTEYSMTNASPLEEFTGFTEKEVTDLCSQYHKDIREMRRWYNGYDLKGTSIYNPNSVVEAIQRNVYESYWGKTSSYEALKIYIKMENFGVREVIDGLLGGGRYVIDTGTFVNDMETFATRDDVLTLLIHLGYLTYNSFDHTISIPNHEIMNEFVSTMQALGWKEVADSLKISDELLQATIRGDEEIAAQLIEQVHQDNVSLLKYNDENALACIITMAYYTSERYYFTKREMPAGKGFADIVFIPRTGAPVPALLVELKWNKSADTALDQIKAKQYTDCLKDYTGKILLVGINYDPKDKKHSCKIERMMKS